MDCVSLCHPGSVASVDKPPYEVKTLPCPAVSPPSTNKGCHGCSSFWQCSLSAPASRWVLRECTHTHAHNLHSLCVNSLHASMWTSNSQWSLHCRGGCCFLSSAAFQRSPSPIQTSHKSGTQCHLDGLYPILRVDCLQLLYIWSEVKQTNASWLHAPILSSCRVWSPHSQHFSCPPAYTTYINLQILIYIFFKFCALPFP